MGSREASKPKNGMLITVSSTEALAWMRADLRGGGGGGGSPFAGESEADCAPSKTAGPLTHAGILL